MAWQGADWDGKAVADATSGWRPCPSELRFASKDVSSLITACVSCFVPAAPSTWVHDSISTC